MDNYQCGSCGRAEVAVDVKGLFHETEMGNTGAIENQEKGKKQLTNVRTVHLNKYVAGCSALHVVFHYFILKCFPRSVSAVLILILCASNTLTHIFM